MTENNKLIAARVIVSCDASPLGTTAIEAAAALAHGLELELTGIFVEDINLLRSAALPFTQEVASATALARPLQADELQNLLQRQAQAVREGLRAAASALRLPWSFHVVRGAPLSSVLDAMRELDLVVFGHAGRYAAAAVATAAAAAPAAPVVQQQPVMVVFDGTAAAQRALAAGAALAHDMHGGLVVAVMETAGDAAALRAQARQQLETNLKRHAVHRGRTQFLTLKRRDAEAVARAAQTYAPAVLLWGGVQGDADRATLATLVDALRCPVVLVA